MTQNLKIGIILNKPDRTEPEVQIPLIGWQRIIDPSSAASDHGRP